MKRYTLEEVEAMSPQEMRALADVMETLPAERQGEMLLFSMDEMLELMNRRRGALESLRERSSLLTHVAESGVRA